MVRIIVDSTADLRQEIKDRFEVVPLTVHFGAQEYLDGIDINKSKFYEMLIESDVLPSTSQPNPDDFQRVYEKVVQAGDTAVVLTISSTLSGTCQSALIAAEDYPKSIYVVDSCSAAIGGGILAELALQLADQGLSACEIARTLNEEKDKICLVALVDTLEYLKKGGRISKTVAFAGGVLNIKPVIGLEAGQIVVLGKARGSKQGNNLLMEQIEKAGGVDFTKPILLGYTGISDALLQKYIVDSEHIWKGNTDKLSFCQIGSVIGTHAGPGAVAVAFFRK
ncbi:MAG: DegV family protein [Oscillospiraceae bacterium]|nr:DegV family protein [Oscillospiraceae bacterium]